MTSKEFAKMIGVSQATVSRALNNSELVSEATKEYIQQKAREHGFVLNSQAQSLKTSQTGTIGILFPLFFEGLSKNLMFTYIYDTVQKNVIKNGYDVMVLYDHDQSKGINVLERIIKSHKVDGIVSLRPFLSADELQLFSDYRVPCVTMFNALQKEGTMHQFILDEFAASYQVGLHYGVQKDYKPVYISLDTSQPNAEIRREGFRKGLQEKGSDLQKNIICDLSMESAYQAVVEQGDYFKGNKTACYVYNDMMAIGVTQALKSIGVNIPEQAQIIGVDDIPMSTWLQPQVSTMHAPLTQIVEDGCSVLFRLIKGEIIPEEVKKYKSELLLRDTTLKERQS